MTRAVRRSLRPGRRPSVPASVAALVLAWSGPGASAADRVELRGGAPPCEGTVVGAGPGGVTVRVEPGSAQRVIPWSAVRAIDCAAPPPGIAAWLEGGADLWRGRLRAERNDWPLALEPLVRAARQWEGMPPTPDGLAAAAAAAEALQRAGRAAEAVRPAFEAIRLARAAPNLAESIDGPAREAAGRLVDAELPIPVPLPPVAFDEAAGAGVRASMAGMEAPGDPALAAIVAGYLAAIEPGASAVDPKLPGKPAPADRMALDALRAIRDARAADARVRASAVASLLAPGDGLPGWFGPAAAFAAGRALASDGDAGLRDRGRVLLASVAADAGPAGPSLAGRAEAEFRRCTLAAPSGGTIAGAPGSTFVPESATVARERADATAEWLESRGEADLLVTHLEGQVSRAPDASSRAAVVARIATILAGRLENEDDEARRDALLAKALAVVERNADGAEELRLAILRSQHRAAQRTAEDRRAGRGDDAECLAAHAQLRVLGRKLDDLAKAAERARSEANRAASFQVGAKAEEFLGRSVRAEQVARSAQFFRAWAAYYAAWLGRELGREDWRGDANAGLAAFAALIEPGKTTVDPKEVSEDLRVNESFASAILGTAMCYALLDSGAAPEQWFALLEAPGTHPSIRGRLGTWRMAAALDRGDFATALPLLRAEADGTHAATASLIAAARAGRDASRPGAAELLTEAVGQLAAAHRLGDLARISLPEGAASVGAGARLIAAVRAIAEANRLRDAGDRAGAERAWASAAGDLAAASEAGDAPAVAAGARALLGIVLRSAGRHAEAADAFLAAAAQMQGERAGDARWSAVLCLDDAARAGGAAGTDAARRRDREVDAIRRELPATRAGTRAAAWRVTHADRPETADIEALLAEDVAADIAPAARRAALQGLHRRFRATEGDERLAAARRALAVGDGIGAGSGADALAELRRRLEMAVAVGDRERAEDAIAAIEARAPESGLAPPQLEELRARRVQVAVLAGRLDEARAEFERLPREGGWTRVAARALAEATFADPGVPVRTRATVARALVTGAERPADEDVVRWVAAETQLLRGGQEPVDAVGAAKAIAAAIAGSGAPLPLLLEDAAFRAARGDAAGAALAVRTALARAAAGSPEWFAAKALQISALAAEDPRKARAVLEQVRRLGNGFGAGPPGDLLRSLDQSLPPPTAGGGGS